MRDNEKIKVVSCSTGYPNPEVKGDSNNWVRTIGRARDTGIIFVDSNTLYSLNFTGGGSAFNKGDINTYGVWLSLDDSEREHDKDRIVIPSDYRTVASSWKKNNEYSFYGRGGLSWSIPYLAGLFTLMLQINKNLSMEEMVKIIHDTALLNKEGLKIINPRKIIEKAKSK